MTESLSRGEMEKVSFPRALRTLISYIKPLYRLASTFALLFVMSQALILWAPRILRDLIDGIGSGRAERELIQLGLLFLGISLLQQLTAVTSAYVGSHLSWTAMNHLRQDLMAHCLDLDISIHKEHTPGEMIERVDGDVDVLANFFTRFMIHLVGSLLLLVGITVMVLLEQWMLGCALLVYIIVVVYIGRVFPRYALPYWRAERREAAGMLSIVEQGLYSFEDMKMTGGGPAIIRDMHKKARSYFSALHMVTILSQTLNLATIGPMFVLYSVILGGGVYLFHQGNMTVGTIYMLLHYVFLVWDPMTRLNEQVDDFPRASAGLLRITELLETPNRIRSGSEKDLDSKAFSVVVKNLYFGYDPETPVLRDITFSLEPGEKLGLLGRTGSGKTTLIRLLLRLYDPDQGSILLAGKDVELFDLRTLRPRVGFVSQEVQLLNASVLENISLFDPEVDEPRVRKIIEELGLGAWLDRLPQGLATQVGPRGGSLSGGEAQILACLRVFLKDPGLIILDEASSRLDPMTESLLRRALNRLIEGRTAIIIAHRLSTVQNVDKIMILDAGRISEYGPRLRLEADSSSRYLHLTRTGLGTGEGR